MANKAVVVLLEVAAKNIDTLNQSFISAADVENGQIIIKSTLSSTAGESDVYTVGQPATATLSGAWMAYSPEDVIVTLADGNQYKVGDMNPQNFTNPLGIVFGGYKPQVGDKILMTAEGFTGAKGGSDVYASAADGQDKLVWGTAAGNGLAYSLESTSYITIPSAYGSHRVTAYKLVCVSN